MRELLIAYIEPPQRADRGDSYYQVSEQAFAMSRINEIYVVIMASLHACVKDVVRDADVLVLRNICEPDFLPIIQDRKRRNKLTVYELADDLSSAQYHGVFFDFYKNIADENVFKLLLHVCDGAQFCKPELEKIYGYLNPHTIVFPGQLERNGTDVLVEFYRLLKKAKTTISGDSVECRKAFQRLAQVEGAQSKGRLLLLNPSRFEDLLYDGLALKQNKNEKEKVAGCFKEAMELAPESHLPYLFGASCLPDPIKALQESLKRSPWSVTTWLILAEEYLKRNKLTSSIQALESAAKIVPDYAIPYIHAARIMRHLRRKGDWLSLVDRAESLLSVVSPSTEEDERKSKSLAMRFVRPKRVLLMSSENGMVYHNCVDGFKDLGWEVIVELFGTNTHNEPDAHEKLSLKIRSYSPHLVLSINQVGCDSDGYILSAMKDSAIPVVIWYLDNPFALFGEDNCHMVKDASLLACFDSSYVEKLQRQTGVFSAHLPHAANPNRFRPPRSTDFVPERDISFVGNLGLDMVCRQRSALDTEYPDLKTLAVQVTERLTAGSGELGYDLLKAHAQLLDIDWDHLPRSLQERVRIVTETDASARRRLSIILELENLGIKVVGGAEWRRYLSPEQLIPPVDYLHGLCRVYQNSRISLNISRLQLRAGVNQRIFDVPAAGGFLLTDRTPELEHYLVPHEEVACYCDAIEAKEKAKYYLSHEKERVQIAAKARKRILQEHTYTHRMEKVLKLLELH